jgi:hypothetical protein
MAAVAVRRENIARGASGVKSSLMKSGSGHREEMVHQPAAYKAISVASASRVEINGSLSHR